MKNLIFHLKISPFLAIGLFFLVAILIFWLTGSWPLVQADTCTTPTDGLNLDTEGQTYTLCYGSGTYTLSDPDDNGVINIGADNITLDCNHVTLTDGDGNSTEELKNKGIGILNNGYDGVTIKNCILTDYNDGIQLQNNADNNIIRDNIINDLKGYFSQGIHVTGVSAVNRSSGAQIFNNTIDGSEDGNGILLTTTNNSYVHHNNLINNGRHGIIIEDNSSGNEVYYNTTSNNSLAGGYAGYSSAQSTSNNNFHNNISDSDNGQGGFTAIQGSTNDIINNNTFINSSNGIGISIGSEAYNITITNNIIDNNNFGIKLTTGGTILLLSFNNVYGNTFSNYLDLSDPTGINGNISLDPLFVNPTDPDGPDNTFWTADDGFRLQASSPVIDVGDPTDSYSNEPQPNGDRINLGAHGNTSLATTTSRIALVYADATSGNNAWDGSSATYTSGRTGPKASLQSCLRLVADGGTCKALSGTYSENITFPYDNITLTRNSESDSIIIDGGGSGTLINFGTANSAALSYVTLQNSQYDLAQSGSGTNTVSYSTFDSSKANVTGSGKINLYYTLRAKAEKDLDNSTLEGVTMAFSSTSDEDLSPNLTTNENGFTAYKNVLASYLNASGLNDYIITIEAQGENNRTGQSNTTPIALNSSATVQLDYTPPSNTSISINSGATETSETTVTLTLAATDATQMMISNISAFTGADWETYATSKSWTLSEAGDDLKTVYVKFRDTYTNTSTAVNDTITLNSGRRWSLPLVIPLPVITPPQPVSQPTPAIPPVIPETTVFRPQTAPATPTIGSSLVVSQTPPSVEKIQENKAKLVKTSETSTVYLVDLETNTKQPIFNDKIFLERGFSWQQVQTVSATELTQYIPAKPVLYPNNSVIKFTDNKVYEVQNDYELAWIPTEQEFTKTHDWNEIKVLSDSMLASFRVR